MSRVLTVLAVAAPLAVATGPASPTAAAAAHRVTFTQAAPIHLGEPSVFGLNDGGQAIAGSGAAEPFRSTITLGEFIQPVTDVMVFVDVRSTSLESLHLLLVGPQGRQALLLAHAGGNNPVNTTFSFADERPAIPDASPPQRTLVRTSVYGTPAEPPHPAPALTGDSLLSTFEGVSVGGDWHLYAYNDAEADVEIAQWSISVRLGTTPYPSELAVAGVGGVVSDLDVDLHVTSKFPDDGNLLLVGPQGQQSVLMSDVGGSHELSNVAITIDDDVATAFPDSGQIVPGSYQPTNIDVSFESGDGFPPPAPMSDGSASLEVFDGTDPNGTWRLFAVDDAAAELTVVEDWSLDIEYVDQVAPAGTVSVAGGAAGTRHQAVPLNLSATDPAPGSGVAQVRLSNDGTTFGDYQPFGATLPWTLTPGDGTKTVHAQFRDAAGNTSTVVTDTIVLDTLGPKSSKLRPTRGSRDVDPWFQIRMWATEPLDLATVTTANVFLKTRGHEVAATLTYFPGRRMIKLDPVDHLAPGRYRVKVRTLVTDTLGNRLDALPALGAQPLVWRFWV